MLEYQTCGYHVICCTGAKASLGEVYGYKTLNSKSDGHIFRWFLVGKILALWIILFIQCQHYKGRCKNIVIYVNINSY